MFIRSCLQFNPISIKRNNKRYHHKINMTINGTLASMDAVFNTSSARSPPTNIRENGNRHNANAQNKRLAFNGSPITFPEMQQLKYMNLNQMLLLRIRMQKSRTIQQLMMKMVIDALLE